MDKGIRAQSVHQHRRETDQNSFCLLGAESLGITSFWNTSFSGFFLFFFFLVYCFIKPTSSKTFTTAVSRGPRRGTYYYGLFYN